MITLKFECRDCQEPFSAVFVKAPHKGNMPKFCTACRLKKNGFKKGAERKFLGRRQP